MGDAAGVGPEIIAKTLADGHLYEVCRPIVIGAAWAIERAIRFTGAKAQTRSIKVIGEATCNPGSIDVLDLGNLRADQVIVGQVTAHAGRASVEFIEEAVRLASAGCVDAMVTAPINKQSVRAAGFHDDIGHQEILARLTKVNLTGTLLSCWSLILRN